jgi:hypothetical protein
MEKTYLIKYSISFTDNSSLAGKEMKVKNCMSDLHAKIKLEEFLKKKHLKFKILVVESCREDIDDIFEQFGKIFDPKGKDDFSSIFGENFKNIFGGKK